MAKDTNRKNVRQMPRTMPQHTYTFEEWMARVDAVLERAIGLSSADLPDWDYWSAYESGITPRQAAAEAFRDSGGY